MTDGSTTTESTEYEAIAIPYVDDGNAKIMNPFVGLCKVENGDAIGLCNIISKRLKLLANRNGRKTYLLNNRWRTLKVKINLYLLLSVCSAGVGEKTYLPNSRWSICKHRKTMIW